MRRFIMRNFNQCEWYVSLVGMAALGYVGLRLLDPYVAWLVALALMVFSAVAKIYLHHLISRPPEDPRA